MRIPPRRLVLKMLTASFVSGGICASCVVVPSYQQPATLPAKPDLPYPSGSEACPINHRILVARVTLCGVVSGSNRCSDIRLKVKFLGDKAFYYETTSGE